MILRCCVVAEPASSRLQASVVQASELRAVGMPTSPERDATPPDTPRTYTPGFSESEVSLRLDEPLATH